METRTLKQINAKSAMFIRQESRDASGAIRGFVYQVERTILAWLNLDEETVLYCECGEDIDYVRQLMDKGSEEPTEERLLEQIKYRQGTALSLRSKEILEAIANFVFNKKSNPRHQLKMRFFTNASPAKEKGIPFPGGLSGLEAWGQVRAGNYNPVETQTTVAYFKSIIIESAQVLSSDAQQSLVDFVSPLDEQAIINELIIPIELAMGNEDAQEMQPLIEAKITELEYAKESPEAEEIFNRLFVHVFHTLSSPGDKRLNKETLSGIVERGTLVDADRELLKRTWALLRVSAERIQEMSSEVASLRVGQQRLEEKVTEGFQEIIKLVATPETRRLPTMATLQRPSLDDPPPFPVTLAPRQGLVASILKMLEISSWVALTASTGMGKTQLARILLDCWPHNRFWISLGNIGESSDQRITEQLLCIHSALSGSWKLWDTYRGGNITIQKIDEIVAAAIGSNSLLVIDNLPNLLQIGSVTQRLAILGLELQKVGGKVITTGQHNLPQEIINLLGSNVSLFDVPSMDKGDINALLVGVGAPAALQKDSVYSFILGVTKGHPVLIVAAVRWLSVNGWSVDNFGTLLSGEPIQEAIHETGKLTRRLIKDVSTREMLDRLSIVGVPFDVGMASVVGKTEPRIERPKEHFDELVGPWIQPLAKSQFEVSPLLQNLWQLYLEPDLQKRLHFDIAHKYLERKTINANDAFQVCIHLHAAEDWKTLVTFLIQFLLGIKTSEHAKYFDWVQWFFSPGKEWPVDIPLSMQISVRALQVRVLIMSGQEYERYDSDLEQLISRAGDEDMTAVAAARFHTGALLEQASPALTAKRSIEAARAWHVAAHEIPHKAPPVAPEMLFWGATAKIKECKQVRPVIEVIKGMSEEERRVIFSSDIGPEMSLFFADSCYATEATREQPTQNWAEVLAILSELQKIGGLLGAEPLYAAAVRARAIVQADFMNNVDEALKILSEVQPGLSKGSSFIILATKSSILLTKKRLEEAFNNFQEALGYKEGSMYRLLYFDTLRRGMIAASQTGRFEHAKIWCKSALNILRKEETGRLVAGVEYQYDYLELLGELAWTLWRSGYSMKSCTAMYGLVQQLVSNNDIDNPRYKETFLKTGHVMGWLASVAYKGEPPLITATGEAYMTPYPGIFCHRAPRMAELPYTPGRNSFLLSQIAMMASGVGLLQLARKAYLWASETAQHEGLLVYATIAELELSSLNSYVGDYGAAFASLLAGIPGVPLTKRGSLETRDKPMEVWSTIPIEERTAIEHFHVYHLVILPALAGLLKYNAKELCLQLIDEIREAIESVQGSLLAYDRWVNIINNMKLAFDTKDQRQNVSDILRTLKPDDHYERLILYIALANQPSTKPGEIANAQAVILPYVNETGAYGDFTKRSISAWIVKSWYEELEKRSFRLNTPQNLRRTLEGIPRTSDLVSDAAKVLLAAEYSADTTYDRDIRNNLMEMAKT
jgi:hypothetical protein